MKRYLSWTTFRRTIQYLTFFLFILLIIKLQAHTWVPQTANLPFRLDPLVVVAQSIASRTILTGSIVVVITLLATVVMGRVWCGWICPLGALLDSFPMRRKGQKTIQPLDKWRKVKYLLLLGILAAALVTNLTLLIMDPLALLFRAISLAVLPAVDTAFSALEQALFPIPFFQVPLEWLDGLIRPSLLPLTPSTSREVVLISLVLLAIIFANRITPRFWCRYLCPLGGLLGWVSKLAIFQRKVASNCSNCKLCEKLCPTGTIQADRLYASDPSECTLCMDCFSKCPKRAVSLKAKLPTPIWNRYDPNRRETLASLGVAMAGVALLESNPNPNNVNTHLIQPPGGLDNNLISKCIRCGECLRVCPTSGLQPSIVEAGIVGFWTPVLVPRIGYCDYACNACGQACPVEAIPPLNLEAKRQQIIGKAYINQNRCLVWSDHIPCIVCEEMCPLPEKAILLEKNRVPLPQGGSIELQFPQVLRDRCIGCGICEYKCPVTTEAAIRVYSLGMPG